MPLHVRLVGLSEIKQITRRASSISVLLIILFTAAPSYGANLTIQFETIARSSQTSIPAGVGTFAGFSEAPAIDANDNIVFVGAGGIDGSGNTQSGIYTYINGQHQNVGVLDINSTDVLHDLSFTKNCNGFCVTLEKEGAKTSPSIDKMLVKGEM